jgi:hypothetical protein
MINVESLLDTPITTLHFNRKTACHLAILLITPDRQLFTLLSVPAKHSLKRIASIKNLSGV